MICRSRIRSVVGRHQRSSPGRGPRRRKPDKLSCLYSRRPPRTADAELGGTRRRLVIRNLGNLPRLFRSFACRILPLRRLRLIAAIVEDRSEVGRTPGSRAGRDLCVGYPARLRPVHQLAVAHVAQDTARMSWSAPRVAQISSRSRSHNRSRPWLLGQRVGERGGGCQVLVTGVVPQGPGKLVHRVAGHIQRRWLTPRQQA